MGTDPIPERASADDFKFKKGYGEITQRQKTRNGPT